MIYSRAPQFIPGVLVESVLLIFLFFCVLSYYVSACIFPCCDVCYDPDIETMFSVSLRPVVFRRVLVLLCSFLCMFVVFVFVFVIQFCFGVFRLCMCMCLLIVMSNILFYQMSLRSEFCLFVPHNKCSIWNKRYYNKSSLDKILCDIYSMPITVFPLHTGCLDYLQLKSTRDVNLLSKLSIIFREWRVIVLFVLLRSRKGQTI